MKRSKQILVKAITRAEYESLPAVVRFFSPPFDVLGIDHHETKPEQPPPQYTADELLEYFDRVNLKSEATDQATTKEKRPSRPKPQPAQPRPAAQSVTG